MYSSNWYQWGMGLCLAMLFSISLAQETQYITIGTGGITGVYYPTGGAICRLLNKNRKTHHIRCSAESTGGSVFNINVIRAGESDFGIVQSDWQYHAYQGSSVFQEAGPFQALRSVFSIHSEPFTVMARADANVKQFTDLVGKRVNIGNPGSGQRATLLVKAVFDNFETFTSLHPAFAHITKESMLQGNSAPLHPGAVKYFTEVGLLTHEQE